MTGATQILNFVEELDESIFKRFANYCYRSDLRTTNNIYNEDYTQIIGMCLGFLSERGIKDVSVCGVEMGFHRLIVSERTGSWKRYFK